jgi:hypothetical protein
VGVQISARAAFEFEANAYFFSEMSLAMRTAAVVAPHQSFMDLERAHSLTT